MALPGRAELPTMPPPLASSHRTIMLIRLFAVLLLTAGIVALVLGLHERLAPHTAQQWQECLDLLPHRHSAPPDADAGAPSDDDSVLNRPEIDRPTVVSELPCVALPSAFDPLAPSQLSELRAGRAIDAAIASTWQTSQATGVAVWPLSSATGGAAAAAEQPARLAATTVARPLAPQATQRPRTPQTEAGVQAATALADIGPQDHGAEYRLEPIELMRQSCSADQTQAARARAELMRRGFNEVQLELTRRLMDANPEVRKELARTLPAMQSIDAAPWLLWLAEDKDSDVRLAAISTLGTTGDPDILRRIETLARGDSDPRIAALADAIGQQQRATMAHVSAGR
jgi:hypothetical protein